MRRWLSPVLLVWVGCADRSLELPRAVAPHDAGASDLTQGPGDPDMGVARDLSADLSFARDLSAADLGPRGDASGTLTLLAGQLGWRGNLDGVGAAARFFEPMGITSDGDGNLYFVDGIAIRKVVIATGAVTTLAGGTGVGLIDGIGAAAQFDLPDGITGDGAGNLYVTDAQHGTIRKIVIATGAVTTLLPANQDLFDPVAVVSDGAGHLYIGDQYLGVSRLDLSTNVVTRLALVDSTGASVFVGTFGIACDGAGNLYVNDGYAIRKIEIASGLVTPLAGAPSVLGSADGAGAAAQFQYPGGLALDGAGSLYVTDIGNNTIRKIVIATGVVTTFAGTAGPPGAADGVGAAASFDSPHAVASDGAGNLYVTDLYNYTIRKIAIAGAAVTTFAGATNSPGSADGSGAQASFNNPVGIASDDSGNVYVVDSAWFGDPSNRDVYGNTIRKVEVATGKVTTLAGTAGVFGSADGIGTEATFNSPMGIASDGAGNLYVSDSDNDIDGPFDHLTIRKIVIASGATFTVASVPANINVDYLGGLAFEGGRLYVAAGAASVIDEVAIDSGNVTPLAGDPTISGNVDGTGAQARFYGAGGLTGDGLGNLYVADGHNSAIRKIVIATGVVSTLATYLPGVVRLGIVSDHAGSLYVAGGVTIQKIAIATGAAETIVGADNHEGVQIGALPASLNCPGYLTLSGGQLIVTDYCENAVLIVNGGS